MATYVAQKHEQRHNQTLPVTTEQLQMSLTKLERLKKQREELDTAIKNAAKDAAKELRANDRDRKIIFGAWCMKQRPELLKEFMANLTTAREKELFENWTPPAPAQNRVPYPNAQKAATTGATPTPTPAPNAPAPKPQTVGA